MKYILEIALLFEFPVKENTSSSQFNVKFLLYSFSFSTLERDVCVVDLSLCFFYKFCFLTCSFNELYFLYIVYDDLSSVLTACNLALNIEITLPYYSYC